MPAYTKYSPANDHLGFDGLGLNEVAQRIGKEKSAARAWLYHRGYSSRDGKTVRKLKTVTEIEDEINARSVTPGPCFKCGCRVCACGGRG